MPPICDDCGKRTRTVIPTYQHPPASVAETFDENRPVPRSVLRLINPGLEAALPWGDHPDDAKGPEFGQICEACYAKGSR